MGTDVQRGAKHTRAERRTLGERLCEDRRPDGGDAATRPLGGAGNTRSQGEARTDSPLRISGSVWPCRLLDFGLLTSRPERESMPVVRSRPLGCNLLGQLQGANAL